MIKWIVVFYCLSLVGCASLPKQTTSFVDENRIEVGEGPEDFQLDKKNNRLIVACDNRRVGYAMGEIWSVDIATQTAKQLEIIFSENNNAFHPHGMSIIDDYLFVVSHKNRKTEEFYRFKIYKDSIVQDTVFSKGIIGVGNDIYAVSKNEFYYSDFKMFGGSIVHYANGEFSKFSRGYKYPNGLIIQGNEMYVTTSLSNKVFKVNLASGKKEKFLKLKGGDNLLSDGQKLYTAAHLKTMKFIKHIKDVENLSPTVVYSIDLETKALEVLFSNDGAKISAGSTGFIYQGKLYISQVYEGFIWVGNLR